MITCGCDDMNKIKMMLTAVLMTIVLLLGCVQTQDSAIDNDAAGDQNQQQNGAVETQNNENEQYQSAPSQTDTGVADPDSCEMLSASMKEGCYVMTAIKNKDDRYCQMVVEDENMQLECMAMVNLDPQYCLSILEETPKYGCISRVAKEAADSTICEYIEDSQLLKDACISAAQ
jgi:hypothetical protein